MTTDRMAAISVASEKPSRLPVVANGGKSKLGQLARAALIISIIAVALTIRLDFRDAATFGGTDLRIRVVGARALIMGLDPYLMPARSNESEWLQDPDRIAESVTRCTYAPTLLLLYGTLSWLPYLVQRFAWVALEWSMLLASILILSRSIRNSNHRIVFLIMSFVFFACGYSWRLHVERGQYYVLILLLFSCGIYSCLQLGTEAIVPGIFFGLAAALRMTPIVVIVPLWLIGYRRAAYAAALCAIAAFLLTLPFGGLGTWRSYFRNITEQERLTLDIPYATSEHEKLPKLPKVVENASFVQQLGHDSINSTVIGLFRGLRQTKYAHFLDVQRASLLAKVLCLVFVLGYLVILGLVRHRLDARTGLCWVILLPIFIDYFLPQRWRYADVQFLAPLALLITSLLTDSRYLYSTLMVLGTLVASHSMFPDIVGRNVSWLAAIGLGAGMLLALVASASFHRGDTATGVQANALGTREAIERPQALLSVQLEMK